MLAAATERNESRRVNLGRWLAVAGERVRDTGHTKWRANAVRRRDCDRGQTIDTKGSNLMTETDVTKVQAAQSGGATSQGRTIISDTVVSKIAGIATREVSGVHALGGGAARAVGALRERIPGGRVNQGQGVGVEVGETHAAVDIDIVAEYGIAIADLAADIRRNVISSVERMTGLEVVEVNITVHDVYPDEGGDDAPAEAPRVQ
jgi:uncharacterized alkaline shock family protein YloU